MTTGQLIINLVLGVGLNAFLAYMSLLLSSPGINLRDEDNVPGLIRRYRYLYLIPPFGVILFLVFCLTGIWFFVTEFWSSYKKL